MKQVTRREFVRYAALGIAGIAGGALAGRYLAPARMVQYGTRHRLAMTEALVEMVDHTPVYHWAFEDLAQLNPMPQMPGPLITSIEGDEVDISLTNTLPQVHGFRIPGVPGEVGQGVEIAPGETREIAFAAPKGGSYLYFDHLNAPVNRVLGLHGPMVVLPASGNTPYSSPTPAVQRLFNDLGTAAGFPGEPWRPEHSRIWLLNSIDPVFNSIARRGGVIDPLRFQDTFLPRYFTIDGMSGAYATHTHSVVPEGRIGQPHLIRILNAGMAAHSLHIHSNHVYVTSMIDGNLDNHMQENVVFVDTMTARPLERMDWLLPFVRPPDIPGDPSVPLRELIPQELAMTLGDVGQSPLHFPMHCHMEMSQTAAGGNYPQGLVTDWTITGDVDGVDFAASHP